MDMVDMTKKFFGLDNGKCPTCGAKLIEVEDENGKHYECPFDCDYNGEIKE